MLNTSENTSGMYTEQITQLTNAAKAIGYDLKNTDLLWEALQAAGSPVQAIGHGRLVQGNKPLAGVGDALLYLVLRMQSRTLNLHSRMCSAAIGALGTFVTTPRLRLQMSCRDFNSTSAGPGQQ